MNVNFITPPLGIHLDCWFNVVNSKKVRKGLMMISHATIWSIWIDRIFKGANKDVEEVFDAIKALSWCWCLNRLKIGVFMFYEWCWNLGIVYLGRFLVFCCSCSALGWLTNSPTVRHCVSLQLVGSVVSVMGLWLLSSAGG